MTSGVATGADHVSLEEAISSTDAARTSAYRLFAHDTRTPQEQFRHEVLTHMAAKAAADRVLVAEELQRATDHIIGAAGDLNALDADARTAVLLDTIRAIGATLLAAAQRPQARALLGVTMAAEDSGDGEGSSDGTLEAVFGTVAEHFGLEVRPPHRLSDLAGVTASLFAGVTAGAGSHGTERTVLAATGPGGALREWTVISQAVEALFAQFLTPAAPTTLNWPTRPHSSRADLRRTDGDTHALAQQHAADPGTVAPGETPRRRSTDISRGSGAAAEAHAAQLEATHGADSAQVADALSVAARSHLIEGNPARAAELFGKNLAIQQNLFGTEHPATLRTRVQLALCALQLPDQAGVETMLDELHAYASEMLGANHPVTVEAGTLLATARARQAS